MLRLIGRAFAGGTLAAAGTVLLAAPALADCGQEGCDVPPPSTSGSTVVVRVEGAFVEGGSPGQPATSSVTVPSPCTYIPGKNGKDYAAWADAGGESYNDAEGNRQHVPIDPNYKAHKGDTKGHYYSGMCDSSLFDGDIDEFIKYSDAWFDSHHAVWVPEGSAPPVPPIPKEVLLQAAQKAMTLPEPTFGYSPQTAAGAATLVNLDTWLWLDKTPLQGTVNASAGGNSALVTADLDATTFSSPSTGTVSCAGTGTPWTRGAATDCSLRFVRASAGTPVEATSTWQLAWSYNGAPQGALDPISTTHTQNIPVNEVQTVVTGTN